MTVHLPVQNTRTVLIRRQLLQPIITTAMSGLVCTINITGKSQKCIISHSVAQDLL